MTSLYEKQCIPCAGGVPPISAELRESLLQEIDGWEIVANHHLRKSFSFKNFADGLEFVNKIGELSEKEAHHPNLFLAWGQVDIEIWTHKIDNLTESDFILAAKINELLR